MVGDNDMQLDGGSAEKSEQFSFSNPDVLSELPKVINFGATSEHVFHPQQQQPTESTFKFAVPKNVFTSKKGKHSGNQYKPRISRNTYKPPIAEFTQSIKNTPVFEQMKKNSKSSTPKCNIEHSITCSNVPKGLLTKTTAKEYFSSYGQVLKVIIRPRKQEVVVYYAWKNDANAAFYKSGEFKGQRFQIQWTKSTLPPKAASKKKESSKSVVNKLLVDNDGDDIKKELEALQNLDNILSGTDRPQQYDVQESFVFKVKKAKGSSVKEQIKKIDKGIIKTDSCDMDISMKNVSNATVEELQNLIKQQGSTSEEKFKILDARDKLMRLRQTKQFNLETAKVTIGTCPDMCPEKERLLRESQRQVSMYELLDSSEYRINHMTAVKQYSRSSADQEEPMPHDLRPVRSLKMTMSYLLHEIADLCEKPGTNLGEWYHFLWDRTRGIRKDITQQELCCTESVELVEQCARFHIVCSERLCAEELSVFDRKINTENLTKCLQTLKYMYHDLRVKGITCKNEPEFQAYIILLNLNNDSFMWDLQKLPQYIQQSSEVKFAIKVYSAIAENNYSRFFKLVHATTYLNACILLRYFNQVRVKALTVMMKAYCRTASTAFSLYELIDIFGFEDENEAISFCEQTGLKVSRDEMYIFFNRQNFKLPETNLEQGRSLNVIESKRTRHNLTIGECISGGQMPEQSYKNHIPHSSFDTGGYLLPESFNAGDQMLDKTINVVDPYEFNDQDEVMDTHNSKDENSTKPFSFSGTFSLLKESHRSEKNQTKSTSQKSLTTEVLTSNIFKKHVTTSKTDSIIGTAAASVTPKSEPIKDKIVISSSSKVFGNKTTTVLSCSPFNMAVNKSIFGGTTQNNVFIKTSNIFQGFTNDSDTGKNKTNTTTTISIPENLKRGKEVLKEEVKLEEQRRKKLEEENKQLEAQKEKDEREKLIKEVEHEAEKTYENLKADVVQEMCASIVKDEINKIEMYNTLSNGMFETLLQKEIEEICEDVYNRELIIRKTLDEVKSRMKKRSIMKFYYIWKRQVHKRKMQRTALEDTPVWIQRESLDECARSMYHPEQNTVVLKSRAKRYKMSEERTSEEKQVPIEVITYSGLKENLKNLDIGTIPRLYWKVVISWPTLENKVTLWQYKKIINQYLNPEDFTMDPVLKIFKPNPYETLCMCIRNFEGFINENNVIGMDGLLFIAAASEDMRTVEKRLTKTVLSRKKLMPIPLVIIVFDDDAPQSRNSWFTPDLENLLESGYISEYTIISQKNVNQNKLIALIQSAILWLVINKSPLVPLEMNYLKNVLSDSLMEELWLRIQGHSSYNPQLTHIFENPNFIINLHNEAVVHLMDIILDPESLMYTDFPPELNKYLLDNHQLPCTYEHFDNMWKNTEYRVTLETVISGLILPNWRFPWPATDMVNLKNALFSYCHEVLPDMNHQSIAGAILSNLFLIFENSIKPSFTYILMYIVEQKINNIKDDLKVVYNKNHIKHFQSLPWWFKSTTFTDYIMQKRSLPQIQDKNSTTDSLEISEEINDDLKLMEVSSEMNDSFAPLDAFCKEKQDQIKEVYSISQEVEMSCDNFSARSKIIEQKLREALET